MKSFIEVVKSYWKADNRLLFSSAKHIAVATQPASTHKLGFYLGVFPCKVSVHLKFWMNLILFS